MVKRLSRKRRVRVNEGRRGDIQPFPEKRFFDGNNL